LPDDRDPLAETAGRHLVRRVPTAGFYLPWLLARLAADPAYGSGPVATIIQGVLSLLTYFLIVAALL